VVVLGTIGISRSLGCPLADGRCEWWRGGEIQRKGKYSKIHLFYLYAMGWDEVETEAALLLTLLPNNLFVDASLKWRTNALS
jgi:hypothetical protein